MFLEEGFLEQMIGRKTKLSVKKKNFRKFRAYYLHTPPWIRHCDVSMRRAVIINY